jgi:LPS sulfotransferase NodH
MNIIILSQPRCGSNWLCSLFDNEYNVNLHEFCNPREFVYYLPEYIQKYHNTTLYTEILSTIIKNCNELNILDNLVRTSQINIDSLITYDLLEHIQKDSKLVNKNLVMKIFYYMTRDSKYSFIIDKFLNNVDYIIRLYRLSILETFISLKKAFKHNEWKQLNNNQKISNANDKIIWNEKEYINFYYEQINAINWIKNSYSDKLSVTFTYEEIHKQLNDTIKVNYVKDKIINAGIVGVTLCDHSIYQKQNNISDIKDNFINSIDFEQSYNNIPMYYKE